MWLHSSVGGASHRFESRWSPEFFFRPLYFKCLNWKFTAMIIYHFHNYFYQCIKSLIRLIFWHRKYFQMESIFGSMKTGLPVKTILWNPKVRDEQLKPWNLKELENVLKVDNRELKHPRQPGGRASQVSAERLESRTSFLAGLWNLSREVAQGGLILKTSYSISPC